MRPYLPSSSSIALFAGVALAAWVPAAPALAQTCTTPTVIPANSERLFDTCEGETDLAFACDVVPLAGPATIVLLDLPYPAGHVSIRSLDIDFQPMAFLLRADCDGHAPCSAGARADADGNIDIDLSPLDSGRYFLAIAAAGTPTGSTCGHVAVTATVTPEQDALMREGVFRSGSAPIWEP